MFHPSRGGVRGGKDQFNWDDVKSDKDRENYLGHSLKAPVGRWQKGKDLLWYTREKGGTPMTAADAAAFAEEQRRAEIQRVKDEEEQLMREALGLAPKRERKPTGHIDKRDAEQLFKREKGDEEERGGERVQGLGFGPSLHVEGAVQGERPAGTLEGEATPAPDHLDPVGTAVKREEERGVLRGDVTPPPPPPGAPSAAALKEHRREERRKKKEERRSARKARKEDRKRRREERKRRRELESSDESDSDVSDRSRKRKPRARDTDSSGDDSSGGDRKIEEKDRTDKTQSKEGKERNDRDESTDSYLSGMKRSRKGDEGRNGRNEERKGRGLADWEKGRQRAYGEKAQQVEESGKHDKSERYDVRTGSRDYIARRASREERHDPIDKHDSEHYRDADRGQSRR